ncbi:MAG: hypothetical protein ACLTDR_10925 [Adlercreutzia equolifaciens]
MTNAGRRGGCRQPGIVCALGGRLSSAVKRLVLEQKERGGHHAGRRHRCLRFGRSRSDVAGENAPIRSSPPTTAVRYASGKCDERTPSGCGPTTPGAFVDSGTRSELARRKGPSTSWLDSIRAGVLTLADCFYTQLPTTPPTSPPLQGDRPNPMGSEVAMAPAKAPELLAEAGGNACLHHNTKVAWSWCRTKAARLA